MKFRMNATVCCAVGLMVTISASAALSQVLPQGVTTSMLQQARSMSPAQQQALAKQYGISLSQAQGPSVSTDVNLGEPGEPLSQVSNDESESQAGDSLGADDERPLRYGRAVFNKTVSTFAPTDDAPVPSDYRLGVGDQLVVQLFGKENGVYTLTVGRDGNVNFPKLGGITLAGLTFENGQKLIETRVSQQLIGVESVVTLGRLRAINIFMSGEVSIPGAYSVSALTTVSQALFQAGGVNTIGTLRIFKYVGVVRLSLVLMSTIY